MLIRVHALHISVEFYAGNTVPNRHLNVNSTVQCNRQKNDQKSDQHGNDPEADPVLHESLNNVPTSVSVHVLMIWIVIVVISIVLFVVIGYVCRQRRINSTRSPTEVNNRGSLLRNIIIDWLIDVLNRNRGL
ncbi:hypothetical protein LSH36_259g02004 [Paralvinella palmiformis]|uniref:Uncharacterized protein n=1 Tax=Paralvinella palmiformis TaxID=53620 RepID=A0AAD9JKI6_9ANNE|nr:hypothetical protein LSH36_259g02004 [Paralvinella palmiformis]